MKAKPLDVSDSERIEALYYLLTQRQALFSDTFKSNLPDLAHFLRNPNVLAWEIGDFKGLVWIVLAAPGADSFMDWELTGRLHFFLWEKELFQHPEVLRDICRETMKTLNLGRLTAEFPTGNQSAILMSERVGFRKVGEFRNRRMHKGELGDTVFLDAVPKDLYDEARQREKGEKAKRIGRSARGGKKRKPELVPLFK